MTTSVRRTQNTYLCILVITKMLLKIFLAYDRAFNVS